MIRKMTKKEILSAYDRVFGEEAKILEIHAVNDKVKEENQKLKEERLKEEEFEEINEIEKWKETARKHPDYLRLK